MNSDDDRQIERIRHGDEAALLAYVEARRPQLLSVIRQHMSPRLLAKTEPEDVFQDTLMHALQAFPTTDLNPVSPFTWLCRLAEQRIIDAHRHYFSARKRSAERETALEAPRSAHQSVAFLDKLVSSMTTPTQYIQRDQKAEDLMSEFEQLPDSTREAIRLRYVEGLSSQAVAEALGKSEGAVRVLLTRGMKKLRGSLGFVS